MSKKRIRNLNLYLNTQRFFLSESIKIFFSTWKNKRRLVRETELRKQVSFKLKKDFDYSISNEFDTC